MLRRGLQSAVRVVCIGVCVLVARRRDCKAREGMQRREVQLK